MELKFAYADPPYYGMAAKFYGHLHPEAAVYDTLEGHRALIDRLETDFPDGWALSLSSTNLKDILPLCPARARVGAWVKPWTPWKPGNNPMFTWEPVIFCGGRKRDKHAPVVRDWCSVNSMMKAPKGWKGAKPRDFIWWIFDLMGMEPGDEFHDLFPGSGAVEKAYTAWLQRAPSLMDAV